MRAASIRDHTEYITLVDKFIVELANLAMDNMIHAFIYSLKPYIKGLVKAHAQAMTNSSLHEVDIFCEERKNV